MVIKYSIVYRSLTLQGMFLESFTGYGNIWDSFQCQLHNKSLQVLATLKGMP